jgi:hypothetical protein
MARSDVPVFVPEGARKAHPMPQLELEQVVRNIDRRLERVEQILPTLATRDELQAAIAPLATREEVRTEARETRRHFDIIAESLRDDIRIIAEGQVALSAKFDRFRRHVDRELAKVDERLTVLEARRRRR